MPPPSGPRRPARGATRHPPHSPASLPTPKPPTPPLSAVFAAQQRRSGRGAAAGLKLRDRAGRIARDRARRGHAVSVLRVGDAASRAHHPFGSRSRAARESPTGGSPASRGSRRTSGTSSPRRRHGTGTPGLGRVQNWHPVGRGISPAPPALPLHFTAARPRRAPRLANRGSRGRVPDYCRVSRLVGRRGIRVGARARA
jgi:hypothetical protein